MKMTVTDAAKQWGVSRTTIYQKIKDGELSRGADKQIDPAEMLRVFGEPAVTERTEQQQHKTISKQVSTIAEQEIAALSHQLELERLNNSHLQQQIKTLNSMIEQYQAQVRQLSNLLDQAQASINEFAQSRLLELKSGLPDDPQPEQQQTKEKQETAKQPDISHSQSTDDPASSGLLPTMQKMFKSRLFKR